VYYIALIAQCQGQNGNPSQLIHVLKIFSDHCL